MKAKLYNLMNWADIEGIVYSEEDRPCSILGPHKVGNSVLYQTFFPDAKKVSVVIKGKDKKINMELADEEGFFAVTAASSLQTEYYYEVTTKEGKKEKREDPYAYFYQPSLDKLEEYKKGILYDSWKYFGCKKGKMENKEGCTFLVRVPGAMRVSLVGEFCEWDARVYPMNRIEGTDIFSLFYPGFDSRKGYLYEVKKKDGSTYLLQDSYSILREQKGRVVSIAYEAVQPVSKKNTERKCGTKGAPFVYSWMGEDYKEENFFSDIKAMGFTHISLPSYSPEDCFYRMPDYMEDSEELKGFINKAHGADLKVIFKWQASHCKNLQEKESSNFYISNILFLIQEFLLDGILLSGLEELFYLDYKKAPGEWIPNIYGGNENLEGIELIKHMVSILKRDNPELLLIAALDALWWGITEQLEKGGLGFDYCYDTAFSSDVINYLKTREQDRHQVHHYLSRRMNYIREQNFIMAFEKETVAGLWEEMTEDNKDKFDLLKTMLSYISFLPGGSVQGFQFPGEYAGEIFKLRKACLEIKERILSLDEKEADNFLFINKEQRNEGTLSFIKLAKEEENSLLILANFSGVKHKEFFVGVPFEGKYQLIFHTQGSAVEGEDAGSAEISVTVEEPWDGFSYKADFSLEPYSLKVFSYRSFTEVEIMEMAAKKVDVYRIKMEEEAKKKIAALRTRKDNLEKRND